ncbi:MAG: hypothetical protein IKM20_08355 [Erysipelotrichales bacterium]|nr:hypothetical protein [Erysipelotrichales bacterium]
MKVITTTGFYGTGSSAITDLFKEIDIVYANDDYEFRIFCDPDGLSDLEYNLIQNPNRHNTSNSIKRFLKQAEFLNGNKIVKRYNKYFGDSFIKETYKYIDNICDFKYHGIWYFDIYERGHLFWFFSRIYSKINMIIMKFVDKNYERQKSLLPDDEPAYAGTFSEDKFLAATKNYTSALLWMFNKNESEYAMLDQLVPPTNLKRYSRYFEDIKIFVVDRDPRDIYLLEKEYWHGKTAPVYDVEVFVKWYRWTRKQYELFENPDNVMKIQFEDMIYFYDKTVNSILNFMNISPSHHIHKMKYFNPSISIKNTKLWEKHPEYKNDIDYIEKELSQYCYTKV